MILLTGATGKTGGMTAQYLAKAGASVRALVRDAEKAAPLKDMGVELAVGDAGDADAVRAAMAGIERVMIVLPNTEDQKDLEIGLVNMAKDCGLKHVVKLSSTEANPDNPRAIPQAHVASEKACKSSGLDWTILRPNFYNQNFLGFAKSIKEEGKFVFPAGNGTQGFTDIRDIAEVAVKVLTEDGHANQSYDLPGPELLTFYEVAERFSQVLGKPVEYVDQPLDEFRAMMSQFIPSEWRVNAVCELVEEIANVGLDYTTDTIEKILGRPARTITDFIEDHKAVFTG